MFDTFTKKCTRNYTAAYTNKSTDIGEFFNKRDGTCNHIPPLTSESEIHLDLASKDITFPGLQILV